MARPPESDKRFKFADVTVISGDLTKMAPQEILRVQVNEAFVGGTKVYQQILNTGK